MTPTIVTRPDPPREEPDAPAAAPKPANKLSKEEIAALLAVSTTNQSRSSGVGSRAKRVALPVMILSTLLGYWLGTFGALVPIAFGIAYAAWPLVTQTKSGWT